MQLPRVGNYNPRSATGNTICVDIGSLELWYSYTTLVAFRTPDSGLIVHTNDWSTTTGKHLNWIDGGEGERYSEDEFNELLKQHVFDDNGLWPDGFGSPWDIAGDYWEETGEPDKAAKCRARSERAGTGLAL